MKFLLTFLVFLGLKIFELFQYVLKLAGFLLMICGVTLILLGIIFGTNYIVQYFFDVSYKMSTIITSSFFLSSLLLYLFILSLDKIKEMIVSNWQRAVYIVNRKMGCCKIF